MSSTHQAKRPYAGSQPSITSYFPQVSTSSQPSYSITQSHPIDSRSPPLPPAVQSNLLTVGMRVRKSVPEGYKTGSYSAFTLFSDNTPISPAPEHKSPQRVGTRPRARELTPFCGILKVGGMAQQQWGICAPHVGVTYENDEEDEDGENVLALSQGSTISNSSMGSVTQGLNKRRYDWDEGLYGEYSEEIRDSTVVLGLGERPIAIPRKMRKSQLEGNVGVVGGGNFGDVDFEDADFLDYGLVGPEVEMDGV